MKTITIAPIKLALAIAVLLISLSSCSDKIEVQQSYDYALDVMPVPVRIENGETVEMRCELIKRGYYDNAIFTIRYFQPDGVGTLKMDDGTVFKPNDRYPLTKDVFRLYYTSNCEDAQQIDIYIEDNFNQVQMYTFEWANVTIEEEEDAGVE